MWKIRFAKNLNSSVKNKKFMKDTLSAEERDQAPELWMKSEWNYSRQQSNYVKSYSPVHLFYNFETNNLLKRSVG